MRLPAVIAFSATIGLQNLPFPLPTSAHVTVTTRVLKSEDSPTSNSPLTSKSKSEDSPTSTRSQTPSKRTKSMQSIALLVDVTPKPTIHVYAPGADLYRVITVTLDPRPGITAGTIRYPKSEMLVTDAERVPVYSRPFQLTLPITIDRKTAGAAPILLSGKLDLQACDDQVCYKPETVPVSWEIRP